MFNVFAVHFASRFDVPLVVSRTDSVHAAEVALLAISFAAIAGQQIAIAMIEVKSVVFIKSPHGLKN